MSSSRFTPTRVTSTKRGMSRSSLVGDAAPSTTAEGWGLALTLYE
jgi:hypothetical protein